MKTIFIISFTNLVSEPRAIRQIGFLKDQYRLVTCGVSSSNVDGVDFIPVEVAKTSLIKKLLMGILLVFRRFEAVYWRFNHIKDAQTRLTGLKLDLVLAHDIETVPLVLKLFPQAKVILDAHEYAPRQFEDRLIWRLLIKPYKHYLCKKYMPQLDGTITVAQGIADEYYKNYGVKPRVITNAPFYYSISAGKTNPSCIRIIHHGIANPSRKIEKMLSLIDLLDERFEIDFMLKATNYPQYLAQLKSMAAVRKRVRVLEPVPMNILVETINAYDVGLYILEPVNFNCRNALPNKLFEFIQARLAVAIGPSPEMQAIVEQFGCGVVAPDFTAAAMAGILSELDAEKIDHLKGKSNKAAEVLCAGNNKSVLLGLIKDVL